MSIFEGHMNAYGQFNFENKIREDGKVKGSGITLRLPVVAEIWSDHLNGKAQLGIVPINEQSEVKFGAIDIDDYSITDSTRELLNEKIKKWELPLIQFRSKSGGIHLFCFTSDYCSAGIMQSKLKDFAALLGYGTAEIFPKQSKLLKERGDIGQWINMPYFNSTKDKRFAYTDASQPLDMPGFIKYYNQKKISPDQLENNFARHTPEDLKDGPPCLHHLIKQGFPEGTRNNGLYNLGVYAQKAYGDKWMAKVEEYNQAYLNPPLDSKEVLIIIASLKKKEYNYSCQKQPLCAHCNASLCRTRKHGIGMAAGLPVMGSLSKLDCDPPIWFIEVENGGRLELSSEDLQNPIRFQKRCLDSLSTMPPIVTRQAWQIVISELLANLSIIPVPKEHTNIGELLDHLRKFCSSRTTDNEEELLRGLVYVHNNNYIFRMADLKVYLERQRFEIPSNKLLSSMRDLGVKSKQCNLRKGVNFSVCIFPMEHIADEEIKSFKPPSLDEPLPF